MTLFERFFLTLTHPHDGILPNYFNKPVDLPKKNKKSPRSSRESGCFAYAANSELH
jgi:hypothetical protein